MGADKEKSAGATGCSGTNGAVNSEDEAKPEQGGDTEEKTPEKEVEPQEKPTGGSG